MATVIDTLFLELGIDASKFSAEAEAATEKLGKMEKAFDKSEAAAKKKAEQAKKNEAQFKQLEKSIGGLVKGFASFTALLLGSTGLTKLATDAAQANRELDNLSKNLGVSSKELAAWQGAAGMAGGSAEGLSGYMQSLSGNMTSLVMMGDTSMLPYFNALGVSMLDGSGKARQLDDVLLDLADSMHGMDRVQAFNLAKQMGMDDGTANTLLKGRQEVERLLALQNNLYRSNDEDMAASQKLAETRAYLNQQWESLLLMLGNALIPVLTEVVKIASGFMDYLMRHERQVKAVFLGMSAAIGLALIPVLMAATAAVWAFMAPFLPAILIVAALGAAFVLLYEDYLVWAEGGKSLFDWGKFIDYINTTEFSVNNLKKAFAYLLTGYTSWSEAGNALFDWLKMKGFIDDTGVSVQSLKTGFMNLAAELRDDLMPYLQDIVDIFMNLKDGNFSGAWEALKKGGERRINAVKDLFMGGLERQAGTIDVATGHDPKSGNSLAAIARGENQVIRKDGNRGSLSKAKQESIKRVAGNIGVSPNDLAAVISFETGGTFSPSATNPNSSATGLIQFMRGTDGHKGYYGMDRNTFKSLSFDEQMHYVEKYFKARGFNKNRQRDVADLYTAVTGFGYKKGSKAYALNKVWDSNRDGYIGKGEMVRNAAFRAHQRDYFGETPVIGNAAAKNLSRQQPRIESSKNIAKGGNVVHDNRRTEVVVQNVNVSTTSSTMQGTGGDMAKGINNTINQFNQGMM